MSSKLATLHELGSVYGAEDVYDLLEIAAVDNANQEVIHRAAEAKRRQGR